MKEIEKVSIAGIAFMLDNDAFEALDSYLQSLKAAYRREPDSGEIIADIEARIAELILSRQDAGVVVSKSLIDQIVTQLGAPEIDGTSTPESPFPRRLYRNKEGAKLGGVCSGIATFFDIDPVWVRLSIFAPLLLLILSSPMRGHMIRDFHGFLGVLFAGMVLLYFLLWVVVPMARSPRQKLEMKGQRITASSIETNLRQEFAAQSTPRKAEQTASVWSELFLVLGRIVLFFLKAIGWIVGISLLLAAMCIAAGFFAALFDPDVLHIGNSDFSLFMSSFPASHLVTALALLAALVPIVALVWMLFCFIFNKPLRGRPFGVMTGIWLILCLFLGAMTIKVVRDLDRNDWRPLHPERVEPHPPHEIHGYRIERTIPEGGATPFDSIHVDSTFVIPADTIQ